MVHNKRGETRPEPPHNMQQSNDPPAKGVATRASSLEIAPVVVAETEKTYDVLGRRLPTRVRVSPAKVVTVRAVESGVPATRYLTVNDGRGFDAKVHETDTTRGVRAVAITSRGRSQVTSEALSPTILMCAPLAVNRMPLFFPTMRRPRIDCGGGGVSGGGGGGGGVCLGRLT